jgi:hypothetical protein
MTALTAGQRRGSMARGYLDAGEDDRLPARPARRKEQMKFYYGRQKHIKGSYLTLSSNFRQPYSLISIGLSKN